MRNRRPPLIFYDLLILLLAILLQMELYNSGMSASVRLFHTVLFCACLFLARQFGGVYRQVWRYGGVQCYICLIFSDAVAFAVGFFLDTILSSIIHFQRLSFASYWFLSSVNLLFALTLRLIYRYVYKGAKENSKLGNFRRALLQIFAGEKIHPFSTRSGSNSSPKIRIAIIGAGRVGVSLVEELASNSESIYEPVCFVDIDEQKSGRIIHGLPVYYPSSKARETLTRLEVQEVVLAMPGISEEKRRELYTRYTEAGCKVKIYDYPLIQNGENKRQLRELDIEELLFRKPISVCSDKSKSYYKDKVILITGGGGSIGSEMCRQLAKMEPKKIIILDIYENGAYDVQQELRIAYAGRLNLQIEICSITHKQALEKVFQRYRPQIIINAAAHKHVPLMEHNCVEAIYNNVFGTRNLVELCEKYHVERFLFVSTDKAVNPTNVMGATKRMCEMIVQSAGTWGTAHYSCTRFGNVLGSAGSVIPLFKKQIASGGPVTITDKRIVRYFMTIPEASQLVLESGAMAKNGELFVLDMGKPIKIYELAQNMIKLSGAEGIEIREIGLRPGEKLYEELLVKTEKLTKTDNEMIFIEKDTALSHEEIQQKLEILRAAVESEDDDIARDALKSVVPTYHSPEEVNALAEQAEEMKAVNECKTEREKAQVTA